jgi:hypothetical protein
MPRRSAPFTEADVARALRGVAKAGVKAVRTEIESGKITIYHSDCSPVPASPFDEWKQRNASSS